MQTTSLSRPCAPCANKRKTRRPLEGFDLATLVKRTATLVETLRRLNGQQPEKGLKAEIDVIAQHLERLADRLHLLEARRAAGPSRIATGLVCPYEGDGA